MDLQLADKVFIVTGGTDGLGPATAKCLIEEGANVLVPGLLEVVQFHSVPRPTQLARPTA